MITQDLQQQLKPQLAQTVAMQLLVLDLVHLVKYTVLAQHNLPVEAEDDTVEEIQQVAIMLVLVVEVDMYILLKLLLTILLVAY